jgi:hypothetical protein
MPVAVRSVGFVGPEARFASKVLAQLTLCGRSPSGTAKAAELIQAAFFEPIKPPEPRGPVTTNKPGNERTGKVPTGKRKGRSGITMKVIELPHVVPVEGASVGTRIATSGARLYRPALRRPIIPTRCFVRRTCIEPQGTILVDASGSMGDWEQIERLVQSAPFATVAYYSGNGSNEGWLYVFARGGFRAAEIVKPPCAGNTVDGLAIDWLMEQQGPRVMITDRGFCDAEDSEAQIMRLEVLERSGEVEVRMYEKE